FAYTTLFRSFIDLRHMDPMDGFDEWDDRQEIEELLFIQECVAELYAFTAMELGFFKSSLPFKYVSSNQNINWSYELIKEFEEYWDWKVLDRNPAVFDKITLGLFFPHRVELPPCTCYQKFEFCEDPICSSNRERLGHTSTLMVKDVHTYIGLDVLCEGPLIDEEELFDIYQKEDIGVVLVYLSMFREP